MRAVRVAVVVDRIFVHVKLCARYLSIQRNRVRIRSIYAILTVKTIRTFRRELRSRSIAYIRTCPRLFYINCFYADCIIGYKFDIRRVRGTTACDYRSTRIQRACRFRPVPCNCNNGRLILALIKTVKLIRPFRCQLTTACIARKIRSVRHFYVTSGNPRRGITCHVFYVIRVRVRAA